MIIFKAVPLLLSLLFLGGCSWKSLEQEVYNKKSCSALLYEKTAVEKELSKLEGRQEMTRNSNPVHYTVVGTGTLGSLHPTLLWGNYFYILPSLTILYYNTMVKQDKDDDHKVILLEKIERIEEEIKTRERKGIVCRKNR